MNRPGDVGAVQSLLLTPHLNEEADQGKEKSGGACGTPALDARGPPARPARRHAPPRTPNLSGVHVHHSGPDITNVARSAGEERQGSGGVRGTAV